MSGTHRGDVRFEADGTPYTLRFDFNALCALEAELGGDIASLAAGGAAKAATLRTMVRIGLARHHGDMTDAQAGDVIDGVGLAAMTDFVGRAFEAAFPEAGKTKTGPRK